MTTTTTGLFHVGCSRRALNVRQFRFLTSQLHRVIAEWFRLCIRRFLVQIICRAGCIRRVLNIPAVVLIAALNAISTCAGLLSATLVRLGPLLNTTRFVPAVFWTTVPVDLNHFNELSILSRLGTLSGGCLIVQISVTGSAVFILS